MKGITLLGPGNGGDQSRIDAVFNVYHFLREICGKEDISVLHILPPDNLPSYSFSSGYDTAGQMHVVVDGKVFGKGDLCEIRHHRKERGISEPHLNSPQSELSGKEEACVLVRNHSEGEKKWISVEAFICPPGKIFWDFHAVKTWLVEPQVRNELKEAGFI